MTPQIKSVLVIAGSDPCGGAGIQADLKTLTVLGVYGAAAITCVTVQNTKGVFSFQPLDALLVRQQIECVLEDLTVSHIKIGMVGSPEICGAIGEVLEGFQGEVIYDPVLRSSTGQSLMAGAGLHEAPCGQVMARATVLTPNLEELSVLTGRMVDGEEDITGAARQMLECFPGLRAVIVKGGHGGDSKGQITDYLIRRRTAAGADRPSNGFDIYPASHPRIKTRNDHGTGCTFASAFAAFHLRTGDYPRAFAQSVSFMNELLRASAFTTFGGGRGAMAHYLMAGQREEAGNVK